MATKKRKRSIIKMSYIVAFDVDGSDPIEVFDTLQEAKDFVAAVMRGDSDHERICNANYVAGDIDKDSIKVYEGVLIGSPRVEITFTK